MNLVAPEEVEGRLQRTLMRRAEDVAAGDGAAWDGARPVSPFGDRPATARRPAVRALAAAAAVVVVVGAAAVGLRTMGGDEPSGSVVADAGDTTVMTPPPTVPPTAPTTGPPTTAGPGSSIETAVGTFRLADGSVVRVTWYPEVALGWERRPGSEDLLVGAQEANYWEGADQRASSLSIFHPDGVLSLDGDRLGMRDDLVAFAAGVLRTPGTTEFEITPPPGSAPA
jgi:hypothetical protein